MKKLPSNSPESLSTTAAFGFGDLPIIELSDESRSELALLLNTEEDTPLFRKWLDTAYMVSNFDFPVSRALANDPKNNQYQSKMALERILNRLDDILRELKSLGFIQLSLLDDADFLANKREKSFITSESQFYGQTLMARRAVARRLENMGKPDKVKRDYNSTIVKIADRFEETFPDLAISSVETCLFYNLVCFFLCHCLKSDVTNPSRLIKKFLGWKKLHGCSPDQEIGFGWEEPRYYEVKPRPPLIQLWMKLIDPFGHFKSYFVRDKKQNTEN